MKGSHFDAEVNGRWEEATITIPLIHLCILIYHLDLWPQVK